MIRKREPHWQSAEDRARVSAELIEEAESLTETGGIATPAEVKRAMLPPPLRVALPAEPSATPEPDAVAPIEVAAAASEPTPAAPLTPEAAARDALARRNRRELESIVDHHPTNVVAVTSLGVLLSRKGLWAEAVPHLLRAVELEPGSGTAWYHLGEVRNHLDDLGGARAAYERAVELEPRHAKALYGLGIVLDRLKRPEEATAMYRRSRAAAGR